MSAATDRPGDGSPRYKVVQWATGNIGTRALRAVIEHPGLDLVGVHVHTPAKSGQDAGRLCGLDRAVGVTATHHIGDVLPLGADCVLYMPLRCDLDEVCALLASGANVVTTRGEFHRPAGLDPLVRERVEAACAKGGTSLHSTGSSPGFITEAVPLVLTSIQRRLTSLTIEEYADLSARDSPGLLFDVMKFGRPPEEFDERRLSHGLTSFGPSLELVADTLAILLDSLEVTGEFALARRSVRIAAGTVPAGTVAAQRTTVTGHHDGGTVLRFRATHYCTADLSPSWEVPPTGWRVTVDGDAPLDVTLRFPVPLEEMARVTPAYTANHAVNAVPVVCAAPAGIRTTADLPQIVARLA